MQINLSYETVKDVLASHLYAMGVVHDDETINELVITKIEDEFVVLDFEVKKEKSSYKPHPSAEEEGVPYDF